MVQGDSRGCRCFWYGLVVTLRVEASAAPWSFVFAFLLFFVVEYRYDIINMNELIPCGVRQKKVKKSKIGSLSSWLQLIASPLDLDAKVWSINRQDHTYCQQQPPPQQQTVSLPWWPHRYYKSYCCSFPV